MTISDYREQELLGEQHNIIRHPDMPRAIFDMLWTTIDSGDEFIGYIKNLCKNGDHYWVRATVSEVNDVNGVRIGYSSIRRQAAASALQTIEPIYKEMLRIEQEAGTKEGIAMSTAFLQEQLRNMRYDEFMLSI